MVTITNFIGNFMIMYAKVTAIETPDKTEITIEQNKSFIYKLVLWFMVFLLIPFSAFAAIGIINHEKNVTQLFIAFGILLSILIFVLKHLRVVYRKEIITIYDRKLIYQDTFLGFGKYFEIKLNDIKKIKYVGYDKYLRHELETQSDVLNFGVAQNEVNYLNDKGTLLLISEYHKIRFGLNVAEEDCKIFLKTDKGFYK